jgi:hypothetical protein
MANGHGFLRKAHFLGTEIKNLRKRRKLESVGKILNIGWIADGAANDASIICPRSSSCPRDRHCLGRSTARQRPEIERIRERPAASAVAD